MEELDIDARLARRLIDTRFPEWAALPVTPVELDGWDNRTFRLGDDLTVRLPSAEGYVPQVEKEHRWLPLLAPQLPVAVPVPIALGRPGEGYPWPWSVYRWIEGETALAASIGDRDVFAVDLAGVLLALQAVEPVGGPAAGQHSAFRGCPLDVYDADARLAIVDIGDEFDAVELAAAWDDALGADPAPRPVWFHGDVAAGNLLVRNGRLAAVIDFGCCGVGDPACDLAIAWTLLEGSARAAFRAELDVDDAAWRRGRGWALWKAMITVAGTRETEPSAADEARQVIAALLG